MNRATTKSDVVKLKHAHKQRARLVAWALCDRRGACARIANKLASEFNELDVRVRPITGSVIVESVATTGLDVARFAARLEELIGEEQDDDGWPLLERRRGKGPSSRLAQAIVDAMRELDADLRRALNQEADLATLISLVLIGAGVVQLSRAKSMPAPHWSTLLWYALRSFVTFNESAVGESRTRDRRSSKGVSDNGRSRPQPASA